MLTKLLLAIFLSTKTFAMDSDFNESKMTYAIVPQGGYHVGYSDLAGGRLSQGFLGGVRFKVTRDGYFFAPDVSFLVMVGLEESPLTVGSFGFITGGHIKVPSIDVYGGVTLRKIFLYKIDDFAPFVRAGSAWSVGGGDLQVYIEGFYGSYSQTFPQTKISVNFPYLGAEAGIQLPIEL